MKPMAKVKVRVTWPQSSIGSLLISPTRLLSPQVVKPVSL